MTKQLIIAEKPSVANDIARALGGFTRHEDYYESDAYVLSSAIGHLLELVVPDEFEVKRGKWSLANLPVIPPQFALKPIEKNQERLRLLTRLIKRKDVNRIINACDAGREGELIFRYIMQHAGGKKPSERLWLQSMTPSSIRDGFAALRSEHEMRPLADAALCRSESDWLVGINGTRAMTAFNSKDGGFYKTTVGRVQTPTLAILVEREKRIKAFVPRDYWEVIATFEGPAGQYSGRWFDEKFERNATDEHQRAERIWDRPRAQEICDRCLGRLGVVSDEAKPSTQNSPLLYDLTTLQREANARFGFSARNTLGLAQALYEKHKVLTYPRTDSRALPEDYVSTVRETLGMLADRTRSSTAYVPLAARVLKESWARRNKRVYDNAKVSDHFAIIPTPLAPKHLSEPEHKLYDLVVKRFLAVFYPPAEFLVTSRVTRVEGEPFKSEGRVLVAAGWLAVYGKEAQDQDAPTLAPVPGGKVKADAIEVKPEQTRPPARYTEATLLSAMENAGKLVEDEDFAEAMQEKGLGTPATRASIIEGLIFEDYVHRNGRELQPTAKAFDLLYALSRFGIDELRSPELTGDWEFKLKQMEQGRLQREDFMDHIVEMTRDLVKRVKTGTSINEPLSTLRAQCPKCGAAINENYKKFECSQCDFSMWKVIASRRIENEEAELLLRERSIGPLQGFRSRIGRPFAAMLKLKSDLTVELDFGQNAAAEAGVAPADFSSQTPLGACPKCGAHVFDHELAYVCEHAAGAQRRCDFRTGKIILQRAIEPEQVKKLLSHGRTDLLHRFISRKGRPFSAFLVRGADGKVGFEFAPRAPRTRTDKPAARSDRPGAAAKIAKNSPPKRAATPTKAAARRRG